MVRRLVKRASQTSILDLTAPVDWSRHVTAKGVASEETLLGTHDKYHLCSNGFSFYLVHLQF